MSSIFSRRIIGTRLPVLQSFSRSFSTSPIILNEAAATTGAATSSSTATGSATTAPAGQKKRNRIIKKEQTLKNILYCNFGKNNTHLALVSVVEDQNFLVNNQDLTYNQKVLYYLRLPQKLRMHLSAGNVGFRKAARGEYEAAFQTTAKMFKLMEENKYFQDLELNFRNFGKGREAFVAALQGKEGTKIRRLVTKVTDSTKLKFGGVRSPAERRL